MKRDSLFKGTFILSISLIFTKILGLIYIIPFYNIIGGRDNMILMNYAYNYYILLLELSSAGIPLTIAKLVSKYNEEGNYTKSRQVAKIGSLTMVTFGVICGLFFIFGANFLAELTISNTSQPLKYTVDELAFVIRTLSIAMPLVMIASGLKGVFQGHEIMTPSAISQFIEQVVRILVMLVGTYIVMEVTLGNVVYANAIATFSASAGAFIALLILLYYYKKYSKNLDFQRNNTVLASEENNITILKEIFYVSIPFVVVSSFFAILSIIDQNTILPAMDKLGKAHIGEIEYNVYNNYINKLVMIAVALAPAFSSAFLPAITRLYVKKDYQQLSQQINKVLLSLFMLVIPALVGMYILTEPLYISFYEPEPSAFYLMRIYLPLAFLYSLYGMTGIIMQAIDKQKINVYTILVGLLFKYSLNETFILKFETEGAIYCSILAYILMIFLNVVVINYVVVLKLKQFTIQFSKVLMASFIMFIVVSAIYASIISNFDITHKIDSLMLLILSGSVGAVIYFILLNKFNFFTYLFGKKLTLTSLIRRR